MKTFEVSFLLRGVQKGKSIFYSQGEKEYVALHGQVIRPEGDLAIGDVLYFPSPPMKENLYGLVLSLTTAPLCPFSWEYNTCPTCSYFIENNCSIDMLKRDILKVGVLALEDEAAALDLREDYMKILGTVHQENLSLQHGARGTQAWKLYLRKDEDGQIRSVEHKTFHLAWIDELERLVRPKFIPRLLTSGMLLMRVQVKRF